MAKRVKNPNVELARQLATAKVEVETLKAALEMARVDVDALRASLDQAETPPEGIYIHLEPGGGLALQIPAVEPGKAPHSTGALYEDDRGWKIIRRILMARRPALSALPPGLGSAGAPTAEALD